MANLLRVRTVINYSSGGPGLSTTYHVGQLVPTTADAQAAVDRVRGAWDVVKTVLPPAVSVQVQSAVDVLDVTNGALTATLVAVPPAVVVGTAITGIAPPQVQAGLILNTGTVVDKRRLRGRLFVGPLATGFASTAAPPAGLVTAVNAMGVALVTIAPPAVVAPVVVWHRPVLSPTGAVTRAGSSSSVLSSQTAIKYFTLRSRLN